MTSWAAVARARQGTGRAHVSCWKPDCCVFYSESRSVWLVNSP